MKHTFRFIAKVVVLIIIAISPELIGGDLSEKLKGYLGDNYFIIVLAIGLLGILIHTLFFDGDEKSLSSNESKTKHNSTTRTNQSFDKRLENLSQKYGSPSLPKESWLKRTFGIETLSLVLLIDRFRKWSRKNPSPQPPPVEYEGSETIDSTGNPVMIEDEHCIDIIDDNYTGAEDDGDTEEGLDFLSE